METFKIGVIGAGNVTGLYFDNIRKFEGIELAAIADLDREKAVARAAQYEIPIVCTVEELLQSGDIDIILNLTTPNAHGDLGIAALEAGKHVYNEKPLALGRADGERLLIKARDTGLRVGSAPDTFLGAGLQTCRALIDEGTIGTPLAATAFMMSPGHESWHPSPEFYYQPGGGPMFDMGPYYLTALVSLLGPVRRVTGSAQITRPERVITSQPKHGTMIKVEVPTHVAGILDFENGVVGTMITSFDVQAAALPHIEIYGTEATLSVPDPNTFGGPVKIKRSGDSEWEEVALINGYAEQSRGLGVADMTAAIRENRVHRVSGELAFHVLDIMHAFHEASTHGEHITLESTCERPALFTPVQP